MVLNLWEDLEKVMDQFKDWILSNADNWVFWLGAFFVGLIIFTVAFNAIHKGE